jgi:hypothetical protein
MPASQYFMCQTQTIKGSQQRWTPFAEGGNLHAVYQFCSMAFSINWLNLLVTESASFVMVKFLSCCTVGASAYQQMTCK